jgi:hypothetical protein
MIGLLLRDLDQPGAATGATLPDLHRAYSDGDA